MTAHPIPATLLEYLHACPLCDDPRLAHYCRVPSRFHNGEFIRYERCRACGLVLRNPRRLEHERVDRYRTASLAPPPPDPETGLHQRYMLRVLRSYLGNLDRPRLLDFGCGGGTFLAEARRAGFDGTGIELNPSLANHVEAMGLSVFRGLPDDPAFTEPPFDILLSSQVFELLADPRATLLGLTRHLTEGGLALIEVPNLNDFREKRRRGSTMDDSHLFYFSARSLTALLRGCGFEVLEVHQGARPFRLLREHAERLPIYVLRALEKLAAASQVRTGLGIVARKKGSPALSSRMS
ncbi:MAG: class I SAM-dependent methyltransferase [Candidatus Binatia bacterium]|nr:class I SAM-dependent methyltransferase [Candidatus Binatia bacterium]